MMEKGAYTRVDLMRKLPETGKEFKRWIYSWAGVGGWRGSEFVVDDTPKTADFLIESFSWNDKPYSG